jgi:hypothetical protein
MMRAATCAVGVFAAATAYIPAARATEAEENHADDVPTPSGDWMVGLGVSLGSFGVGPGAGLFPGAIYATGLEVRVAESLWLTGEVGMAFSASESALGALGDDATGYHLSAKIGMRPVINPRDRVQLSVFGKLGSFYARDYRESGAIGGLAGSTGDGVGGLAGGTGDAAGEGVAGLVPATYDARSWAVLVDAGLAVDFWIADPIALRLASRVLSAGHQRTTVTGGPATGTWFAELGLRPAVSLQVAF